MARSLPIFCLHRIRSADRPAAAAPALCANEAYVSDDHDHDWDGKEEKKAAGGRGDQVNVGRKVMVVADSGSEESRTALQWALSHSVRPCDTVVLLDVVRTSKNRRDDPRGYHHLEAMRSICQMKRPEVHVEVSVVEGTERGPAIVEAARKHGASLLVMGQKRRSVTWRLLLMWLAAAGAGRGATGAVEYCVQNATCMALAVRRKSRRGGGYLITTRRHRDFWLLA